MTIIELSQGYYSSLTGTPKDEALSMFAADDKTFLDEHPSCKAWHRPCWLEREVKDDAKAPWGHEWYTIEEGLLKFHSADYDSSG